MPSIVFIDDQPDSVSRFVESLDGRAECKAVHPEDVTEQDLASASLVLVDSRLETWPERDRLHEIALRPLNGKALAAVLRVHAGLAKKSGLTAFALLTAHAEDYSSPVQPDNREHALARANNLEWIFRKTTNLQILTNQFLILAEAVTLLPKKWPLADSQETEKLLEKLLALKADPNWTSRALLDIKRCHPPIHELSEWTYGMELLRWLLHRIFPYPTFLWDRVRVAARLRMTVASLDMAMDSNSELARMLGTCEYTGLGTQFLGRRWWRSGLESLVWEMTNGKAFDLTALQRAISDRSTTAIEFAGQEDPIVCIDENHRTSDEFCDFSSAVRLLLDDWPSYAEVPWIAIRTAAQHPELMAAVMEEDQEKMNAGLDRG